MITAQTQLLGLIGWPVSHSLSPVMHNAAAAALDLDVVYLPLAVMPGQVEMALRGLVALNFLGVNVTIPHKQAVMAHLGTIDSAARAIGAVNTIKITNPPIPNPQSPIPNLQGYNTDWSGFLADLESHDIPIAGRNALVLGAGGSARAIVYALARKGARVTVYARRLQQARQLVHELQTHLDATRIEATSWPALQDAHQYGAPLIINTTPVGMHPDEEHSPWPEGLSFPPASQVYDLIYNPKETRLMQQARAAGCHVINGLGMLLHQGAQAFELWTGVKPPLDVMADALREQGIG